MLFKLMTVCEESQIIKISINKNGTQAILSTSDSRVNLILISRQHYKFCFYKSTDFFLKSEMTFKSCNKQENTTSYFYPVNSLGKNIICPAILCAMIILQKASLTKTEMMVYTCGSEISINFWNTRVSF